MHRLPRALSLRNAHPHIVPRIRPLHPMRPQRRWKSQLMYRSNGDAVRYQAVRFKRRPVTLWRLATWGFYTGAVYFYAAMLWRQLDVEIEFVEEEELAGQEAGADEEAEGEEQDEGPIYADEESTFIPLTWSKKMPRTFYRGSDPEWQDFIKIAKDTARHKKIQDELVQIVHAGSLQHPSISRQLGQPIKVGKYWLDISFPDGPPQEYERQGIEIGDGFVAWSTQKVDADKQWRTERALIPRAAAEGIWKTTKVLAGIQWRRIKQQLGWGGADPLSPEERFRTALEMQQREQGAAGRTMQPEPSASSSASAVAPSPRAADDKRPWQFPNVPLPMTASSSTISSPDIPIAMHVFSSALSKSWNPKKAEPPRGTFVVQGLVEVRGAKGRIMFDVQSCYDPRANKFVHINAGVRGYKRWKQSPKGGP